MSRFPDGTILFYKLDKKAISVEVTTKELITCKNCKFCHIENITQDIDGVPTIVAYDVPVCTATRYHYMTREDGYCDMAKHRGENDGR